MQPTFGLPAVNRIGMDAPWRWLAGGWSDLWRAWRPCLAYGLGLAVFSLWITWVFVASNAAFWVLALTCGFVFVAPMLAMGLYEAGRRLEHGEAPTLRAMLFLPQAVRQDVAYLGLALLTIYFLWGRIAQVVYGLSTFVLHHTVKDFVAFALGTQDGHAMLVAGSAVGGVIAFFTYTLVVVAAPMLLDSRASVFAAAATSFRAVSLNFAPMLLWAAIIAVLTLSTAATAFTALIVVFPWLGLASWRAYRELVAEPAAAPA
ncbi:MAG: DUF2189 domain-containing protein [Phenylobacterium sp.]|uniref:DUF2189 domain-containing protein n=1 Tax=Phenylobacterium sp. TaxID=1871053 RepID=UPI00391B13A0